MRKRLLSSVLLSSLACFGMLGLVLGLGWSPKLGLDLRGGLSVTYKPAHKVTNSTLQTIVNIMDARANALGVSQPNITTQGEDVVVQLPGVKNPRQVLKTIGTTAQLYFRPVLCGAADYTPPAKASTTTTTTLPKTSTKPTTAPKTGTTLPSSTTSDPPTSTTTSPKTTATSTAASATATTTAPSSASTTTTLPKSKPAKAVYVVPPTCTAPYLYTSADWSSSDGSGGGFSPPEEILEDPSYSSYLSTSGAYDEDHPHQTILLPSNGQWETPRVILGPEAATGKIVKTATAELTQQQGWVVEFSLTGSGETTFNALAAKYYHTLVADDLDGQIITAASINATNFDTGVQVTGSFNSSSANALALVLNYGSFPVRMIALTSQTVSASLGASSLRAGLLAGALGLLLVMGYTIFYYRALGIVVVLGLVTTGAFLYGLISALGASSLGLTLDLSGITGLIVSVGITVDSYIVYFERLKDEVRAGRSIRASVDKGFKSAYRTILSADAVSFLGALVLWLLSVGDVKGFAFMLGISTLTDVVTAYVFTRPLVIMLGRNPLFTEARWVGIARGLARTSEAPA